MADKLEVIITATDQASGVIKGLAGNFGGLGNIVSGVFSAAMATGAAAVTGLTTEIWSAVKSASESENVFAQTQAVIKSTGGVAGVTASQADKLATSLQGVTRFSDETILSAENIILTFTNIGKNIFPQTTETVLDMAQALGVDTKNAAIQLGKALQDPIEGTAALRRVGVNFTDAQQEMIKKLVEAGKLEEAQKLILKELNTEFGNSARAAGKTFAGQLDILKNTFDNVQEGIGQAFIPVIQHLIEVILPVIEKYLPVFVDVLTNSVAPALNKVVDAIAFFIDRLGAGQSPIQAFADTLKEFTGIDINPILNFLRTVADKAAIAFGLVKQFYDANIKPVVDHLVGEAVVAFNKTVNAISSFISKIQNGQSPLDAFKETMLAFFGVDVQPVIDWFRNLGTTIVKAFTDAKTYYDANIKPVVDDLVSRAATGFSIAINFVSSGGLQQTGQNIIDSFQPVVDWFNTNWPIIQAVALTVWTVVQDVVMAAVDTIVQVAWPQLKSAFDSLGKAFSDMGITWGDVGAALMTGITVVAEVIGAILIALVAIVVGVVNGIATALNYIIPVAQDLVKNVSAAFTGMMQFFIGIYFFFDKLFRGDIPGALQALAVAFDGAKNWIINSFLAAANFLKLIFGGILALVGGFVTGVVDFFVNLYNRLVGHSIIPDMMNAIVAVIRTAMALIGAIFQTGWAIVTGAVNKVGQQIQTTITNALNFARKTLSQFQQFGADVIGGILAGIAANASSLVDYITDVVNDTVQAVLDSLQIGSPSRVFANIGANMMKGMQVGILKAGDLARDASLNVTQNLINDAGRAKGDLNQNNYGPVTYQFNGMANPQDVLTAIKQLSGA